MRILQLHNHHASKGGAMEVLEDERQLLESGGHTVHQYTLPAAEEMALGAARAGAKAIWNVEAYRDVRNLAHDSRIDIVHVHTPFPLMSPSVFRAAKSAGVPTVTTLHSFRYSCIAAICYRDGHTCEDCVGSKTKWPGVKHRCYHDSVGASVALTTSLILHRRLGTFEESVDRFIALTDFSKDLLVRDGIPPHKIVVKPNSVSDPLSNGDFARQRKPYIAFVGRLIDVKGIKTLLDAWRLARPQRLQLRIAGDGPLAPLVQSALADDASISSAGWLDEASVTQLMAQAEATVVPSEWYEGQPLVILRSLAVGTPVLVSDLANLSDNIAGTGAGLTFCVGESSSLAARLRQLDSDPASSRAMANAARTTYLLRHTPQRNLASLETIYQDVLSGSLRRLDEE